MVIKNIKLKNFRNYKGLNVDLYKNINILHGKNAQGKTNLLEAIYLCCVGKSLRGKDKELIKQGENESYVYVKADRDYGSYTVEIYISDKENKKISINKIPILKMGELLGSINAVYFSPDELKLIKDAPQCRRKFLDIDLSQVNKKYFYTLQNYNKILMQRNNVLKSRDKSVFSMLEIYDEQLAVSGCYIIQQRKNFIESISGEAAAVHKYLTETEVLELSYLCSVQLSQDAVKSYIECLKKNIERDVNLGYTSIGPHRDDIKIISDGIDVRIYGSQGQQRTCALSLKLSELKFFKDISGEYPILLLDDVLSELDPYRKQRLLNFCSKVQTILTTADDVNEYIKDLDSQVFEIKNGTVKT